MDAAVTVLRCARQLHEHHESIVESLRDLGLWEAPQGAVEAEAGDQFVLCIENTLETTLAESFRLPTRKIYVSERQRARRPPPGKQCIGTPLIPRVASP